MARLGRYLLADQPLHVIQRGNDRQAIFFHDGDYACYRRLLAEAARHHGCAVHAYVLMTNHVHLLLTPSTAEGLSRLMQWLGVRYVRHVNTTYRRTGTLWEGRFRAAPIESESHLLTCCRYIELNPVRARMVAGPADYPWSSYRAHADGAADPVVTDHAMFAALGATAAERQAAYRALFEEVLDEAWMAELRAATNGGWALGSERFQAQIAAASGRRAARLPKGRPPLEDETEDGEQFSLL
jgi:putative transposase